MRTTLVSGSIGLIVTMICAAPTRAQTYTFERTFNGATRVDVATHRGKISIVADDEGRIVVAGTVTVRRGLNMPANSGALAGSVSDHPPIRQQGATVQVRPPEDPLVDRVVTVDYDVRVPPGTTVVAANDSGEIVVSRIEGTVSVRTDSGRIDIVLPPALPVTLEAATGSGELDLDRDLVKGTVEKGRARGAIRGGGVSYQLTSKSGAIRVR